MSSGAYPTMDNNKPDNDQERRRRTNDDNLFGTKHCLGNSEEKSYFNGPYGRREVDVISNDKTLKEAIRKLKRFAKLTH